MKIDFRSTALLGGCAAHFVKEMDADTSATALAAYSRSQAPGCPSIQRVIAGDTVYHMVNSATGTVATCRTELSRLSRWKLFRQLQDRVNRQIASLLVNERRSGAEHTTTSRTLRPLRGSTMCHRPTINSKAVRSATSEYSVSIPDDPSSRGSSRARAERQPSICSVDSFSPPMIHRLRCQEPAPAPNPKAKGQPDYSRIPAVWPQWINWTTPAIGYNSRRYKQRRWPPPRGSHRSSCVNSTGPAFATHHSRNVLEGLVHAELCATVAAAVAWALTRYAIEPTWTNTGALAVLALMGASVVCRWLVLRIVKWAQVDASVSTAQLLRKHPAARARSLSSRRSCEDHVHLGVIDHARRQRCYSMAGPSTRS